MFETKLAMRLQSGEPKCANCKWWEAFGESIRPCHRYSPAMSANHTQSFSGTPPIQTVAIAPMTTDLSVCSKWEMKA
jgi:hypothetical protein